VVEIPWGGLVALAASGSFDYATAPLRGTATPLKMTEFLLQAASLGMRELSYRK
jgi:hypothetical protein